MEAGVICILLAHLGAFSFGELKTLYYSTMICDLHFVRPGAYTSHIKIFLILCIQFVLCMDCQFMK